MKRNLALIILAVFLPQFIMAQTFSDAFKISNNQIQGTARAAGMGNAFGALGGDFTSLSINPAGSAVYQSGEFVLTPGFRNNKATINTGGSTFTDINQGLILTNIGAVGAFKTNRSEAGIISINYGIGYNRLADFSSNAFANFDKSSASYLDDIADYANSLPKINNAYLNRAIGDIDYQDWPSKLAWESYLINPATDAQGNEIDGTYNNVLLAGETVDQRKSFIESGHLDEYLINLGLNFNHKFYLGTTIGMQDLQYSRMTTYEELLPENSDFQYYNDYYMEGYGFNFKIGAIYRPVQELRLGLAFHSPTFFQVDDLANLEMDSYLTWETDMNHNSWGESLYNYDFNTPMKLVMSGAMVFGKNAIISVDAEYLDYANMRFRRGGTGSDDFSDLNSDMGEYFKSVFNLRMGAEYKITNQFSIRGGYQNYGNPFVYSDMNQQSSLTNNVSIVSAGFGYSVNSFSLNVAYTNALTKLSDGNEQVNYYQLARENNNQNILLSLGFRF